MGIEGIDIDLCLTGYSHDVGHDTRLIDTAHAQDNLVGFIRVDVPRHFNHTVRFLFIGKDIGAVDAMDRYPMAAGNIAYDRVAWNGVAAAGKLHHDIIFTLDEDAMTSFMGFGYPRFKFLKKLGQILGLILFLGIFVKLNELYHDRAHKDAAIADGSQQIFLTAVKVGTCGHFLEVFARQELCRIIAQAPAFMFKHIPSIDNIFFPPFLLEKLTDLIFGLT